MLNNACIYDISEEECNRCDIHGIITACVKGCEHRRANMEANSYDKAFALGVKRGLEENEELINEIKYVIENYDGNPLQRASGFERIKRALGYEDN